MWWSGIAAVGRAPDPPFTPAERSAAWGAGRLTLESAIEFIATDELVKVTPHNLRLRKRLLSTHDRRREAGRAYDERRATEPSGSD